MNSAFNSGTSGVSSAMQALAQSIGKSPDLSAAASAFGKMKFAGTKDALQVTLTIRQLTKWASLPLVNLPSMIVHLKVGTSVTHTNEV
jgi:hypothetical protein